MNTGTDAKEAGLYVSTCCNYEAMFAEGETLVRCPECSGLTTWEFQEAQLPQAA
jgi:hypothetical protein